MVKSASQNSGRIFLYAAARIFLGGVFAYAGYSKLIEPVQNFQASLAQYGLVPASLLPLIAHTLPWIEWLLGVFLLAGFLPRITSGLLALVSLGFAAGILLSGQLWAAPGASCGCFGEGGLQVTVPQMFVVDLLNVFFGLFLFRSAKYPWSLESWLRR